MKINTTEDIRNEFRRLKADQTYRGNSTIEIQNACFRVDSDVIFGKRNEEYIEAEIAWYESMDRSVQKLFDIYGKEVKIWADVADDQGQINSNYGWAIYTYDNGNQYDRVYYDLHDNPLSRQAVMIYTNPEMHKNSKRYGMNDFMCTNTVQYFLNHSQESRVIDLDCQVNMRSNDAVFGFINDVAWQQHVLNKLARDLSYHNYDVQPGTITWNAGSLHVYDRHWDLII